MDKQILGRRVHSVLVLTIAWKLQATPDACKSRTVYRDQTLAEIHLQAYFFVILLLRAGQDARPADETVKVRGPAHCS